MTYTNRKNTDGTYMTPNRALLNITNVISYIPPYTTKFSIMAGQNYISVPAMADDEIKAINAGWYAIVAVRSAIQIKNFNVVNQLKLSDSDHAFIIPSNLGAKLLQLINVKFNIYGTVMNAFTTLSFYSLNVYIDTTNLIGGYVFVTSCNITKDVVINDVTIDGLTLDGP